MPDTVTTTRAADWRVFLYAGVSIALPRDIADAQHLVPERALTFWQHRAAVAAVLQR